MTHRKRLALIIASAVGFILITPAALFYALGYRYYPETGDIAKIGMIIAQFEPSTAQVLFEGKEIGRRSPVKIRNLTPATYAVEIKREGYHSWKKDMDVRSGLISWTPHIILFPTETPKIDQFPQLDAEAVAYQASDDTKKIVYVTKRDNSLEIFIYDTDRKTTTKIFPRAEEKQIPLVDVRQIHWSHDARKLVIEVGVTSGVTGSDGSQAVDTSYIIYDDRKDTLTFLRDLFGFSIERPTWDKKDSAFLYWMNGGNLHRFDTERNTLSNALENDIHGFEIAPENDSIYYIKKSETPSATASTAEEQAILWKMDADGSHKQQITEPFTLEQWYDLRVSRDGQIAVIGQQSKALMIVTSQDGKQFAERIAEGVEQLAWDQSTTNQHILVYATAHELNAYLFERAQHETITRISPVIRDIILFPEHSYVVFETESDIQIVDLTFEGNRNNISVAPISSKALPLAISPDGSLLSVTDYDDQQKLTYYTIKLK